MHLETINNNLKVGDKIKEGEQIGTMGGTGSGKQNKYTSHLHYELIINNEYSDPVIDKEHLIDPQKLITPKELPEVKINDYKIKQEEQ